MDSGGGCTTVWIYLMSLNYALKIINIINIMLHIFCHTQKKRILSPPLLLSEVELVIINQMAPTPFLEQETSVKSLCRVFPVRCCQAQANGKDKNVSQHHYGSCAVPGGQSHQGSVLFWRCTWHLRENFINDFKNCAPFIGDPVKAAVEFLLTQKSRAQSHRLLCSESPMFALVLCCHHLKILNFFNKRLHIIILG